MSGTALTALTSPSLKLTLNRQMSRFYKMQGSAIYRYELPLIPAAAALLKITKSLCYGKCNKRCKARYGTLFACCAVG